MTNRDGMSAFSKIITEGKPKVGISDEELDSLTHAIKTRYGMDFTNYEKASLKRGFTRLIQKHEMKSVIELWSRIMKDRDFLINSIDELTVNLTELFRNPEFWLKLKKEVLPQMSSRYKLDFWHAGCSSGEEVYTMAMVLKDMNLLHKSTALGTDLSNSILAVAKQGKYSNFLINRYLKTFLHYFPSGSLSDWFDVGETDSVIKDRYKKHVEYKRHDLVRELMDKKFDIIFCRNVMIYFDDVLKMKVLKLFHASLKDDGFFAIGYYDMLPNEHKELFEVFDSTTRLYKKKKI